MPNILLIETGGTIASTADGGIIGLGGSALPLPHDAAVTFERITPYQILSENLRPTCWEALIRAVATGLSGNYAGILITHGSDTLAFTSAMIGLYFAETAVPIVLTAANKPPEEEGSNAADNLAAAVHLILTGRQGVFTVYRNAAMECEVFLATRVRSADLFSDCFSSVSGRFGVMVGETLQIEDRSIRLPSPGQTPPIFPEAPVFSPDSVAMITPYPGLNYDRFDRNGLRAILHLTYHSSTACCEGEATSALCFVERCKQQGVDFYLAPLKQKPETGHCYTTTDALLKAGAIPLYGISPEAAYAKLLLAYHLPNKDPKKWMQQPRYFEQAE